MLREVATLVFLNLGGGVELFFSYNKKKSLRKKREKKKKKKYKIGSKEERKMYLQLS